MFERFADDQKRKNPKSRITAGANVEWNHIYMKALGQFLALCRFMKRFSPNAQCKSRKKSNSSFLARDESTEIG